MPTILIIDGYPCVRDLIEEEMKSEGYRVRSTGDLESIPALITSWDPDCVIMDLYLENRSRWDLLVDIKRRKPNLPVIIHTSYEGYLRDDRLLMADGFVIKSLFFDELKKRVAQALKIPGPVLPFARDKRPCDATRPNGPHSNG